MENKGVIYILTNPSFPEYVKIGYADDVNKRLAQLNRSECTPFASDVYLGLMKEHNLNNEGLNLSEKKKLIYELIKKHKQVTSKFIIETTSFSHATVERTIKKTF